MKTWQKSSNSVIVGRFVSSSISIIIIAIQFLSSLKLFHKSCGHGFQSLAVSSSLALNAEVCFLMNRLRYI